MIELKAKRTEHGTTYQKPNGELVEVNCALIHYDNWDGRGDGVKGLRKCDPVLVTGADNSITVEFMPYTAKFPANADGVLEFRDARKGINLGYTMQPFGIAHVSAEIAGDEVVYRDAYGAGCDLVYRLRASGVAKLVRIATDSKVDQAFSFAVSLPSDTTIKRKRGSDSYTVDRTGQKVTDSDRVTVFERAGVETYLYPFRWRSGPDHGILSVQIENAGGDTWLFTKPIPTDWSRTEAIELDLTATGTILADGYLGKAGTASYVLAVQGNPGDAGQTVLGTDPDFVTYRKGSATRYCIRGVQCYSNTVPATATVSAINIHIKVTTSAAENIRIVDFTPDDYAAPDNVDFCAVAGANPIHIFDTDLAAVTSVSSTGDKTISLNAAGLAEFVPNGNNGYAFRAETYDTGSGTAYTGAGVGASINYSENATPANRPSQTITYTLPAVTNIPGAIGQLAAIKSLGVLAA